MSSCQIMITITWHELKLDSCEVETNIHRLSALNLAAAGKSLVQNTCLADCCSALPGPYFHFYIRPELRKCDETIQTASDPTRDAVSLWVWVYVFNMRVSVADVAVHECADCVSVICECVCVLIGGLLSWKITHLSPSGPLAANTSLLHLTHNHISSQVNSTRTTSVGFETIPTTLPIEAATQEHFNLRLQSNFGLHLMIFVQMKAFNIG